MRVSDNGVAGGSWVLKERERNKRKKKKKRKRGKERNCGARNKEETRDLRAFPLNDVIWHGKNKGLGPGPCSRLGLFWILSCCPLSQF